jgi:hypothetical protein
MLMVSNLNGPAARQKRNDATSNVVNVWRPAPVIGRPDADQQFVLRLVELIPVVAVELPRKRDRGKCFAVPVSEGFAPVNRKGLIENGRVNILGLYSTVQY